jgi:hypothetical protein
MAIRSTDQIDNVFLRAAPALLMYLERIGAVRKSFRKAVVESYDEATYNGLRRVLATVHIRGSGADAMIECDKREYAPTESELADITPQLAAIEFPYSTDATLAAVRDLQDHLDLEDKYFYKFKCRAGDNYCFVQQRINPLLRKTDLPWSMWSDGNWRQMEPDGQLPLYGLDRITEADRDIMLHEGAKTAWSVDDLVNNPDRAEELAAHPWGDKLKLYAHVGWPGGATNAARVDWSPLRNLTSDMKVVVSCDKDQVGEEALSFISLMLQRPMMALMYKDDQFPERFDLADDWPNKPEWWKHSEERRRYIGPTFQNCLVPATWATQQIKDKEGPPSYRIRTEFAKDWFVTKTLAVNLFVHARHPHIQLKEDSFNTFVRPFSHVDNPARLLKRLVSRQCDSLGYMPGARSGIVNVDGENLVNTHQPSTIKAIAGGDDTIFQEYLKHLLPVESERHEVLRWIATLIACPHIRILYGLLLVSEMQGVGKSTLGEAILAPLLGMHNVSFPGEEEVVNQNFNGWFANKRLAVIHEIYAGHSSKAYTKLKTVVADRFVDVNEKYKPTYRTENHVHLLACSNSPRALQLENDDRRWYAPRVTEEKKDFTYWKKLHKWLNEQDGLGIILNWAREFVMIEGNMIEKGQHAPDSAMKTELIAAGRSDGQRWAFDLGSQAVDLSSITVREGQGPQKPIKIVLSVDEVHKWVEGKRKDAGTLLNGSKSELAHTLRKELLAAGMREPPLIEKDQSRPRYRIGGERSTIVANFEIPADATWHSLKTYHRRPGGEPFDM